MNKRDLQRLEGLLLLALLHKTKNKRLSASVVGISVDTLTKYINFLEDDIGEKLQLNHKNSCAELRHRSYQGISQVGNT